MSLKKFKNFNSLLLNVIEFETLFTCFQGKIIVDFVVTIISQYEKELVTHKSSGRDFIIQVLNTNL